MLMVD
jgi:hypothetical protein